VLGRRHAVGSDDTGTGHDACPTTPAPESDTILIGEYGSMTGSSPRSAVDGQRLQLAVEEKNAAGGIKGKKISVKLYDDQGKTPGGRKRRHAAHHAGQRGRDHRGGSRAR
jgi:ABC-type branched-subunit amino acid transport system substrate-binding protein